MPKGNNFTAPITEDDLAAARSAAKALHGKLRFVPQQPATLLTSATMSPERLPLAKLALQAADQDPDVMRKTCAPDALRAKISAFKALTMLRNSIQPDVQLLDNAINVLDSNILFMTNNIHEDIEKDKGESSVLGELRPKINAYYARPNARKSSKAKPA
jgi:hypothetical protein